MSKLKPLWDVKKGIIVEHLPVLRLHAYPLVLTNNYLLI